MCFVKNQPPFCYMRNGGRIMIFAYRLLAWLTQLTAFTLDTYAFLHQSCLHPSPSWTPWATPVGIILRVATTYPLKFKTTSYFTTEIRLWTVDKWKILSIVTSLRKHTCEFQAYIWSTRPQDNAEGDACYLMLDSLFNRLFIPLLSCCQRWTKLQVFKRLQVLVIMLQAEMLPAA